MRGEASIAATGSAYRSLMARLAALQEGIEPDAAAADAADAEELAAAYRRRIIKTYFGCGLVTSLILGFTALLPMLYAHPGSPRNQGLRETAAADAAQAATDGGVIEVPIGPSQRADAHLPLQIAGAGGTDSLSIVLRDLPETAWLSQGERQDEHTWLLRPADLADLRLSLRAGTPEAFDMTIDVASAASEETARTKARIRVLDAAVSEEAAKARRHGLEAPFRTTITVMRPPEKAPQKAAAALPAARPQLPAGEVGTALPLPAGTQRVTRPDGISALGALSREPEDSRKVWWKMPTPAWAPFMEPPGRN